MEMTAVVVDGISKRFGSVEALKGISLEVRTGSVMAILGPNGAGKTTLVRILTTLLLPDSGTASVMGYDVVRHAAQVREVIGLAGQYAAVDENLTGRENLEMVGRLYHLVRSEVLRRADELLEMFRLAADATRLAKTYSGGMRRRLDLAATLVARPKVLFLDEPTAGLDPRSRMELWRAIRDLVNGGVTVLLTTQYLEEADRLADVISIIDVGRVVAQGTAEELKSKVGGQVLSLRPSDRAQTSLLLDTVKPLGTDTPTTDDETGEVVLSIAGGAAMLPEVMRRIDTAGIVLSDMSCRHATLDNVFLALTGRSAASPGNTEGTAASDMQDTFRRDEQ
jgi:daunorubicin resistance ABC transporter ATP-binding subunit